MAYKLKFNYIKSILEWKLAVHKCMKALRALIEPEQLMNQPIEFRNLT